MFFFWNIVLKAIIVGDIDIVAIATYFVYLSVTSGAAYKLHTIKSKWQQVQPMQHAQQPATGAVVGQVVTGLATGAVVGRRRRPVLHEARAGGRGEGAFSRSFEASARQPARARARRGGF